MMGKIGHPIYRIADPKYDIIIALKHPLCALWDSVVSYYSGEARQGLSVIIEPFPVC